MGRVVQLAQEGRHAGLPPRDKSNGKEGWVHEKSHTAFISSGNGIYGPRGWNMDTEDDFTENK